MSGHQIRKRVKHHFHKAKHHFRKHLTAPHNHLMENNAIYRWWHEQNYHRHIHYAGMILGIIVAVYYVMLDGIFQEVSVSSMALINLLF